MTEDWLDKPNDRYFVLCSGIILCSLLNQMDELPSLFNKFEVETEMRLIVKDKCTKALSVFYQCANDQMGLDQGMRLLMAEGIGEEMAELYLKAAANAVSSYNDIVEAEAKSD